MPRAIRWSLWGMLCCGCLLPARAAENVAPGQVAIQRVFGPELPGPYKHPASIGQLDNGDLYLVYYAGSGEYGDDTAVYGARQKAGSREWSKPQRIADTPFRSEGNGVIWQAPDGKVWLFYVVRYGATWSTSRIQAKISEDGAQTWSDPIVVSWEEGAMVRSRPIALRDGDYLLPCYHETGHDPESVGNDTCSFFLRYSPKTHTFTESSRISSRIGNLQPSVVQLNDKDLVCYCRRGGDYKPHNDVFVVRSESHDGGRTWSEGKDSAFPNPNSAIDFIRLANGHLLLVYNDSMTDRSPLTVAISTDEDRTYPFRKNIKTGKDDFAYPTAIQTADGKIHIVYTSHERTVIEHAVFEESAITE